MFQPVDLISLRYRNLQEELHARPKGFGGKGGKWAPSILALVAHYGASSVLDYGCGQGGLLTALRDQAPAGLRVSEYDPAVQDRRALPVFADVVACTDVLEHIEPEKLGTVLSHLHLLARKAVFFVVALDPANKTLADGRNAHLIQESPEWWQTTVEQAGFRFSPVLEQVPLPVHYTSEKRGKRWIAVGEPC